MKIRITPGTKLQDRIIGDDITVPPRPPRDLNDFFNLTSFTLSETSIEPFNEVDIQWIIETTDPSIEFSEYRFRLKNVTQNLTIDNDIAPTGTMVVRPISNTLYRITVEKRGLGNGQTLGSMISIMVDQSNCIRRDLTRTTFTQFVDSEYEKLLEQNKELKKRLKVVSTNPPKSTILNPETDLLSNPDLIKIFFPFQIDINNFFDGDLDVRLELFLSVRHENEDSYLNLESEIKSHFDFSTSEDILSLGSSAIVAKTVNKVLPLYLNCKKPSIERNILNGILMYLNFVADLDTHRLLDVQIDPDAIIFLLCVIPIEAPAPGEILENEGVIVES